MIFARRISEADTSGQHLQVRLSSGYGLASREEGYWGIEVHQSTDKRRLKKDGWEHRQEQQDAEPAPSLSFPVLSGTVAALREELEAGMHDGVLAQLKDAEEKKKNRATAIAAIEDRMELVAE